MTQQPLNLSDIKKLFVSRINQLCGKCTIYVFGSYAYGKPSIDSDIDIAVIMEKVESKIAKASELWDAFKDVRYPKDIVIASQKEFDFYRKEAGSLFRTIADKGVVLSDG